MKYLIAVDDTDDITKEVSTGEIAELIGKRLKAEGATVGDGITRHQLLLSDQIAYTSHNSCMSLEAETDLFQPEEVLALCESIIRKHRSPVSDPGVAVCCRELLKHPDALISFGFDAKRRVIRKSDAYLLAASLDGILLKELGGSGIGVIGALAGIGLRMSRCDGSLRGKSCRDLDGQMLTAEELCKKSGAEMVISVTGRRISPKEKIRVEGYLKLMFFDGFKCCMVKPGEDGVYQIIRQHQERERLMHLDGTSVCGQFQPDNDEEEMVVLNGAQSCFNCLYRRWTDGGYLCMHQEE